MASPLPQVPKTAKNPFEAIAKGIGQKIAATRPQPSANIQVMVDDFKRGQNSPGPAFSLSGHVHDKLGELYDYAKMRGVEGEGGYLINNYNNGGNISDAEISKTSIDQELPSAYGDAWEKIRESIVAAPKAPKGHPFELSYGKWGTPDKKFEAPAYVVTRTGEGGDTTAMPYMNFVELAPKDRAASRIAYPLSFGRDHEFGHLVANPSRSPGVFGYTQDALSSDDWIKKIREDYPELSEDEAGAIWDRMQYEHTPSEMSAIMGQMRRMEYGLTGNKMITPEDRIRAVTRWFESPPPKMIDPAAHWSRHFQDPVMQEGPRAGQPAHGFEQFRSNGRRYWQRATPEQKKDFLEYLLPNVGAAGNPSETQHV